MDEFKTKWMSIGQNKRWSGGNGEAEIGEADFGVEVGEAEVETPASPIDVKAGAGEASEPGTKLPKKERSADSPKISEIEIL